MPKCEVCFTDFENSKRLSAHRRIHNKVECKWQCGFPVDRESNIVKHELKCKNLQELSSDQEPPIRRKWTEKRVNEKMQWIQIDGPSLTNGSVVPTPKINRKRKRIKEVDEDDAFRSEGQAMTEISDLRTFQDSLEKTKAEMELQLQEMHQNVTELKESLENSEELRSHAKESLEECKKRAKEFETNYHESLTCISTLEENLAKDEKRTTTLEKKLELCETKKSKLETELNGVISELKVCLSKSEELRSKVQENLEDTEKRAKGYQTNYQESLDSISKLEECLVKAKTESSDLREELKQCRQQKSELEESLSKCEELKSNFKDSLEDSEKRAEEIKVNYRESLKKISMLDENLITAQNTITHLEERLKIVAEQRDMLHNSRELWIKGCNERDNIISSLKTQVDSIKRADEEMATIINKIMEVDVVFNHLLSFFPRDELFTLRTVNKSWNRFCIRRLLNLQVFHTLKFERVEEYDHELVLNFLKKIQNGVQNLDLRLAYSPNPTFTLFPILQSLKTLKLSVMDIPKTAGLGDHCSPLDVLNLWYLLKEDNLHFLFPNLREFGIWTPSISHIVQLELLFGDSVYENIQSVFFNFQNSFDSNKNFQRSLRKVFPSATFFDWSNENSRILLARPQSGSAMLLDEITTQNNPKIGHDLSKIAITMEMIRAYQFVKFHPFNYEFSIYPRIPMDIPNQSTFCISSEADIYFIYVHDVCLDGGHYYFDRLRDVIKIVKQHYFNATVVAYFPEFSTRLREIIRTIFMGISKEWNNTVFFKFATLRKFITKGISELAYIITSRRVERLCYKNHVLFLWYMRHRTLTYDLKDCTLKYLWNTSGQANKYICNLKNLHADFSKIMAITEVQSDKIWSKLRLDFETLEEGKKKLM